MPEHPASQTGDLWLLGATVTCPKCRKTSPLERAKLGIAEIPVMVAAGWSEAQKRVYRGGRQSAGDYRVGVGPGAAAARTRRVEARGFDLSLTGFGDLELKDIMAERTEGLTDPDDAPAVPEHPVSQTGDLWLLGATVTCPKCRKTSPLGPCRPAGLSRAGARTR